MRGRTPRPAPAAPARARSTAPEGKYAAAARAAIAQAQAEQRSRAAAEDDAAREARRVAAREASAQRKQTRALATGSGEDSAAAVEAGDAPPSVSPPPAVSGVRRLFTRRRLLNLLSLVLLLASIGLFAYPVGTDLYAGREQQELKEEAVVEFTSPTYQQKYRLRKIEEGKGLTRLRIPELGVDTLVVEGTSVAALRAGAGHYTDTALPGEVGNVGIAGHRTTFGRPFGRMDELGPGDEVILDTPLGSYTYRAVEGFARHGNPWVVKPLQTDVLDPVPGKRLLTLTTCHPKGSARERLILRLELVSHTGVLPGSTGTKPAPTQTELPST